MQFTYYGTIRGQGRPRFSRKLGRAYESKADKEYKASVRKQYVDQTGGAMLRGELSMDVDIYRAIPRSRPMKVASEPDVYKIDADNALKAFLDALNGVAYEDDRFVTSLRVTKHPRTRCGEHAVITLKEVER